MYAQNQGRDVLLGFSGDLGDLGEIISTAANIDFDNEGSSITEACKIFCRGLLQMENTKSYIPHLLFPALFRNINNIKSSDKYDVTDMCVNHLTS